MSTQQPSSMHPDEMDIQDVFSLFQRSWYKFLALIFRAIDFIFKFWWIIALLIIGGVVLGYFSDNSSNYKSRLVLKTNYQSQSYVYNAVIQFNLNISEGDVAFMKAVAGLCTWKSNKRKRRRIRVPDTTSTKPKNKTCMYNRP